MSFAGESALASDELSRPLDAASKTSSVRNDVMNICDSIFVVVTSDICFESRILMTISDFEGIFGD